MLSTALITVIAIAIVALVLGVIALLRAKPEDIPAVLKAIGRWFRFR